MEKRIYWFLGLLITGMFCVSCSENEDVSVQRRVTEAESSLNLIAPNGVKIISDIAELKKKLSEAVETLQEDEFEIVEPDSSFRQKEYEFRGERYYLVPRFYRNGWLALILVMVEDEDEYIVLSVNLEEMDALGLPDRTFIDVNNYPDALDFLVENRLATDSGYKRRSGFVEYPMAMLNLPLLYQHNPQIFQKANIEPFGEECF